MKQRLHIILNLLMALFAQKIPVQLSGLAPLLELGEFLAHKEQLFPGMAHHKGIGRLQVRELIIRIPRHLIVHGAFQMHHFVMGKHQNIVFTVSIGHGKGHQVMGSLAEIGVQFHVFQEIIHPPHIPFKGEAQAVILRLISNLGPGCGLLGNHHGARVAAQQNRIQMLEELHCFQVFISSVFVRHPLS